MDAHDIDTKLIDSAFALIAERGWFGLSLGEAARNAGFEPAEARARMPDMYPPVREHLEAVLSGSKSTA